MKHFNSTMIFAAALFAFAPTYAAVSGTPGGSATAPSSSTAPTKATGLNTVTDTHETTDAVNAQNPSINAKKRANADGATDSDMTGTTTPRY